MLTLRQLALKNGIALTDTNASGSPAPRKADRLNSELARVAYDSARQKNVTAWLALRNKAAHGQYGDYTLDEVKLFAQGVRLFISLYPA